MPRRSAVGISGLQAGEDVNALVLQGAGLKWNPAQAVFAGLRVRNTPPQFIALELFAGFGVVLANLLNGWRTDQHALAFAQSVSQLLQVES